MVRPFRRNFTATHNRRNTPVRTGWARIRAKGICHGQECLCWTGWYWLVVPLPHWLSCIPLGYTECQWTTRWKFFAFLQVVVRLPRLTCMPWHWQKETKCTPLKCGQSYHRTRQEVYHHHPLIYQFYCPNVSIYFLTTEYHIPTNALTIYNNILI
jgi:hypothetical protein